jgi:hypothetical protein
MINRPARIAPANLQPIRGNHMQTAPRWPSHNGWGIAVVAAVSTIISLGILAGVTGLFQSRGMPLEDLAAAERACKEQVYVSQRETCMNERVAAARDRRLARE